MTQPARLKRTPEEYLAFELDSLEKHELVDGELFAMAGASRAHNRITVNVLAELREALRHTPCEPYASDLRVRVEATGLYTYPDASVVCGESVWAAADTLLNPTLLVEVLSPSTEAWDRGRKREHYQSLPSLQEYLLVAQDAYRVEQYVREGERWLRSVYEGPEAALTLSLRPAGKPVRIRLADLYEGVTLEEALPPTPGAVAP